MKKVILTLVALCLTGVCTAQKAESMKLSGNDAITVLQAMGVEMYKFDLRKFQDKTYNFSLYVDEYTKGEGKERIKNVFFGSNKRSMTDEDIAVILKYDSTRMEFLDFENKLMFSKQEVSIIIRPGTDSTAIFHIDLLNAGSMGLPFKLHILEGQKKAIYYSRPFEITEYDDAEPDIPLMLYGSAWIDGDIQRFCGEITIQKDLSSDIVEDIPHFYVIGLKIEEAK